LTANKFRQSWTRLCTKECLDYPDLVAVTFSCPIYRDLAKDGTPWKRIATLTMPADTSHTHIYSVEPIAPETGVNGTSWFSLNAMAGTTGRNLGATGRSSKDGSIWVLSLGTDPADRIARRVDEGATSGMETARYEAESMFGENEVFIYYERKSPETGRGEIRRCRTGIRVESESKHGTRE